MIEISKLTAGIKIKVINNLPLVGNEVAPPLILNKEYTVLGVILDTDGNPHLDVGLPSKYNWITSFETKKELPNGDKIHWCHPSRFELV